MADGVTELDDEVWKTVDDATKYSFETVVEELEMFLEGNKNADGSPSTALPKQTTDLGGKAYVMKRKLYALFYSHFNRVVGSENTCAALTLPEAQQLALIPAWAAWLESRAFGPLMEAMADGVTELDDEVWKTVDDAAKFSVEVVVEELEAFLEKNKNADGSPSTALPKKTTDLGGKVETMKLKLYALFYSHFNRVVGSKNTCAALTLPEAQQLALIPAWAAWLESRAFGPLMKAMGNNIKVLSPQVWKAVEDAVKFSFEVVVEELEAFLEGNKNADGGPSTALPKKRTDLGGKMRTLKGRFTRMLSINFDCIVGALVNTSAALTLPEYKRLKHIPAWDAWVINNNLRGLADAMEKGETKVSPKEWAFVKLKTTVTDKVEKKVAGASKGKKAPEKSNRKKSKLEEGDKENVTGAPPAVGKKRKVSTAGGKKAPKVKKTGLTARPSENVQKKRAEIDSDDDFK